MPKIIILDVPKADVFINGEFVGSHNEYTIRNMQVEMRLTKKWASHLIEIVWDGQKSTLQPDGYIRPIFNTGFFDKSYQMSMELLAPQK